MPAPIEIFDEWIAGEPGVRDPLGTRYHPIPQELTPPFEKQKRIFDLRRNDLNSMFLLGRNIEIYLDFLDDPFIDAIAGIHQNLGLIAINMATVILPYEMFFNMFSHPGI